jgi:hypothetical protein
LYTKYRLQDKIRIIEVFCKFVMIFYKDTGKKR